MKRRQAIRNLGVGFTSAVVGASWISSCKPDEPLPEIQWDGNVIIIGAGPAGLYAADILMSKGVNVTVLEATGQIGGRVRSLRNQEDQPYQSIADFPVELGADYFQGSDSILGKIVSNLNLQTVELTEESKKFIINNQAKSGADWASNGDYSSVRTFVNNLKNYSGPATSMRAASGVPESAVPLLNSQTGNFWGSTADRVGVKGVSEGLKLVDHDTKYYVLRNNTMQDLMISRFNNVFEKVMVNSPVKSINYSTDPVTVTLEDGTQVTGSKVIITVPITILKSGITFSPALPAAKTTALNRIGMDPSIRVILDFKKNFWGTDSSLIFGGSVGPQYFNAGIGRSSFFQTLSVTVNGPKALELSNLGNNDTIVTTILGELDKIYNNQATGFIRKSLPPEPPAPPEPEKMIYFIKDWTKEKYAQGGFSYPLPATTIDDRVSLAEPLNDKLFFAGEATDISGEAGTVNGALSSAERVVEDVVFSIKKVID